MKNRQHHHHHDGPCDHDHDHDHDHDNIDEITIHGPEDFEGMRKAGKLAAQTLDFITPYVKVGITTEELNQLCHQFIIDHGAVPAPLGYRRIGEINAI